MSKDRYAVPYSYSKGFACVKVDDKWAFRDKDGNVSKDRYDDAFYYHEGFAIVKLNGKWAFRDEDGNLVLSKATIREEIAKDPLQFENIPGRFFRDKQFVNVLIDTVKNSLCENVANLDDVSDDEITRTTEILKNMKNVIESQNKKNQIEDAKNQLINEIKGFNVEKE